jgi:hypothetical protein
VLSIDRAGGAPTEAGLKERIADAERRFEDARTLYQAEGRKLRDELKWRRLAEDRITDLESKLTAASREVEDVKAAQAKDAQDLLANAKERLESLHTELSETFAADQPSDTPEYLRTLEDLVASNALLKHDTTELARTLAHTLEENRALKDEIDELRLARLRPGSVSLSTELRPLLMRARSGSGHGRTTSTSSEKPHSTQVPAGHKRVASAMLPRTWDHRRNSSIAPSFTSTSTSDGPGVTSPTTGIGGGLFSPTADSPTARHGVQSPDFFPLPRTRSSSGGIGYVHNGVPKTERPWKRPRPRSMVDRRSVTMYSLVSGPLNEDDKVEEQQEEEQLEQENGSESQGGFDSRSHSRPASESQSQGAPSQSGDEWSERSRKRASVFLPSIPTSPHLQFNLLHEPSGVDLPPFDVDATTQPNPKRTSRRTLLLLSRSTGVQTDPIPEAEAEPRQQQQQALHQTHVLTETEPSPHRTPRKPRPNPTTPPRRGDSVDPDESLHEPRGSLSSSVTGPAVSVAQLVEFLTKVLTRLRGVDIPTLNRRLKKQNLPSDVSHVSRSTISALQAEVAGVRHRFRGLLDATTVSRRELGLLLTLLRDVFTELLELQSTVNDVTLDPRLAKKLRREAFEDDKAKQEPAGGLWAYAAPLTSYFSTSTKTAEPAPPTSPAVPAAVRAAPKVGASTLASTASVTVEFGGSSVRAAPASPKRQLASATGDVFDGRTSTGTQRSVSAPVYTSAEAGTSAISGLSTGPGSGASGLGHGPAPASRRVRTRASRSDLMGIFAGAQPSTARVRPAASQVFREPLSTIVDAVLDPEEDDENADGPLLQRTLRPRGLSDSSIRSTAILDPVTGIARVPLLPPPSPGPGGGGAPVPPLSPAPPALPIATRAVAMVTQRVDGASTVIGSLTRRLYGPYGSSNSQEVRSASPSTRDTSSTRGPRTPTPLDFGPALGDAVGDSKGTDGSTGFGPDIATPTPVHPIASPHAPINVGDRAREAAAREAAGVVSEEAFPPSSLTRWQ